MHRTQRCIFLSGKPCEVEAGECQYLYQTAAAVLYLCLVMPARKRCKHASYADPMDAENIYDRRMEMEVNLKIPKLRARKRLIEVALGNCFCNLIHMIF